MRVTISDEARRYIALFEDETGATARDCVVLEDGSGASVVFVIEPGQMGQAIGPDGRRVEAVEDRLGRGVELVEGADTAEAFVANALAPAAVHGVTVSEGDTTVAYADVPDRDRGVAIGTDGRNVRVATRLAKRHFDVDDIQLT